MLEFVTNLFASRVHPIGIDFGTDCLRLAQVQEAGDDFKIAAAASAPVPAQVRNNPEARLAFFTESLAELMSRSPFHGRRVVLGLPASVVHLAHLQLPPLQGDAMKQAVLKHSRKLLPMDADKAFIRHCVAGDIDTDGELKSEVIVMAVAREWIDQYLLACQKARLDVVGMNVEPLAMVDCFWEVYRRKADHASTQCFIDIGSAGTRVIIASGRQMLLAKNVSVGGDDLTRAVAEAMHLSFEDAKTLRIKLAASDAVPCAIGSRHLIEAPREAALATPRRRASDRAAESSRGGFGSSFGTAVLEADEDLPEEPLRPARSPFASQMSRVQAACRGPIYDLAGEIESCLRHHESVFANLPVERLIFVGGEARHRVLVQQIAAELQIPAQLGDPLCRMSRTSDVGVESGIDRRSPQPAWAVAIGLSMGPAETQE
jgi:type IV pilus assembly protein PilM